MDFNYSELKGKIVACYGSQEKFAATLEIAPMTVYRKLSGKTAFTRDDMLRWAAALHIPKSKIGSYFFK